MLLITNRLFMKYYCSALVSLLLLSFSSTTFASDNSVLSNGYDFRSGFATSIHASSLGVGANLHYRINHYLAARAGIYTFGYSQQDVSFEDDEENTYLVDADFSQQNIYAGLDVFPFRESFKLSLGYLQMASELSAAGNPENNLVTINGTTYNTETEIKSIDGILTLPDNALYAGLGWGNPTRAGRKFGFLFEVGAMFFMSKPEFSLTANCFENALTCHQVESSIAVEEEDFQAEFDKLKILPVVNFGISYQF